MAKRRSSLLRKAAVHAFKMVDETLGEKGGRPIGEYGYSTGGVVRRLRNLGKRARRERSVQIGENFHKTNYTTRLLSEAARALPLGDMANTTTVGAYTKVAARRAAIYFGLKAGEAAQGYVNASKARTYGGSVPRMYGNAAKYATYTAAAKAAKKVFENPDMTVRVPFTQMPPMKVPTAFIAGGAVLGAAGAYYGIKAGRRVAHARNVALGRAAKGSKATDRDLPKSVARAKHKTKEFLNKRGFKVEFPRLGATVTMQPTSSSTVPSVPSYTAYGEQQGPFQEGGRRIEVR